MPTRTSKIGLPRRVLVCYLLFCLLAIVWLVAGSVVVSQRVLTSRAENHCVSRVGKASSVASLLLLRQEESELQRLVEKLRAESGVTHAAVASSDGRFLAHSDRSAVGQRADRPVGSEARWGDVCRVRFVDRTGALLREYRVPLKTQGKVRGELHMAVAEPNLLSTGLAVARVAPLGILAPLGLVAVGGFLLVRMVRPLSAVESQLRQLAGGNFDLDRLRPVKVTNATTMGWNRIVQKLADKGGVSDLQTRLAETVDSRQQSRLQHTLNALSDGLAVTDAEGKISFANHAVAALLSEESDQLLGQRMEELVLADGDGTAEHPLRDPGACRRTVVAEIKRANASGTRVLRAARHPVRQGDESGSHVWSVRDVTQQKLADKMRDQFLDSATHELRTPLANIRAYAETLALSEMTDVERQKEFCNTINVEATRLSRFIEDLLDLSSIEAGGLSISPQLVEVKRLLHEVADKVRPLMDQKGLTFDVRIPDKLPELKLDKDKVATALVNLLGNATKYTPDGGRVALKVDVADGVLQLEVEDSGFGIAEEELGKIFDKFFRSSDKRVRGETGTGLGLSLAREIICLHGGDITARSELDRGSTFTVTLPVH
jgi:PAS domain S-box-containing protein